MKFTPMPKIPRLEREIIITEKIDGTNANILIQPEATDLADIPLESIRIKTSDGDMLVTAGSRTRWLTTTKDGDNFGFAKWVHENAKELIKLGPGHHFGEWWGQGIQRHYDLDHRRFSLFNVSRWTREVLAELGLDKINVHAVPHLISTAAFDKTAVDGILDMLREEGSRAAPGFMNPEGVVVYHTAANQLFKKTFEGDATGKERA